MFVVRTLVISSRETPSDTPTEKQATAVYPALHTARVAALTAHETGSGIVGGCL
ncbi:hypothetical protein GNE08_15600 [Trichormus variabilis ARAD]|uniref:Uncharacterized protein n=1 Tax=Trichormus variabilis N2B TaxID=2681315 RepID=A0ABR6S251_ANAVA|nr:MULTISPECIES: hypothetical protein [Nostocaceae]MBC1215645.1 hypothetical protein [Trichormus variabilis ARAD]MBC1257412.1 hypothetical protein [Trichormus variabilis V5]MBC1266719.1 hypothetical protein [Trichormus variabilis FSR]MBC1300486.1 hypothetical protein [Trichormus variabilis N2B]MBC1310451.1 hypothetical protein [Trichormus variabilis PNB]